MCEHMLVKRATVTDLRYRFGKIERYLRAGEEVEITKRGRVIARTIPVRASVEQPDFMARLKKIFGDRVIEPSAAELVSWDREGR